MSSEDRENSYSSSVPPPVVPFTPTNAMLPDTPRHATSPSFDSVSHMSGIDIQDDAEDSFGIHPSPLHQRSNSLSSTVMPPDNGILQDGSSGPVSVEALVKELAAKKSEITTLEQKIATQRSHEVALERRLKRSREDAGKFDEENSSLRRENAELKNDNSRLESEHSQLESRLRDLKRSTDKLERERDRLRAEKDQLQTKFDASAAEVKSLENSRRQLVREKRDLIATKDSVKYEYDKKLQEENKARQDLETRLEATTSDLRKKESAFSKIRAEKEKLTRDLLRAKQDNTDLEETRRLSFSPFASTRSPASAQRQSLMADFARSPSPATALQPPLRMHQRRRSKSTGGELLFPFDSTPNVSTRKFEQPLPFSNVTPPISASTPTSPNATARGSPGLVLSSLNLSEMKAKPRPSAPAFPSFNLESVFADAANVSAPSTLTRGRSSTAPDQLTSLQASLSQGFVDDAKSSRDSTSREVVDRLDTLKQSIQALAKKVDSISTPAEEKTSEPRITQEEQIALISDLRAQLGEIQRNVNSVRQAQETQALEERENKRKAKEQLKEQDKVSHELQEARETLSSSSKLTPNQFGEIHSALSTLFEHMKYSHGLEDNADEKTRERVMEMDKLLGDVGDKIDSLQENQRGGGSVSPAEGAILRSKLRGMVEKLANLEQTAQVQVKDVLRKLTDVSQSLERYREEVQESVASRPEQVPRRVSAVSADGFGEAAVEVLKTQLGNLQMQVMDVVGGLLQVTQGFESTDERIKMIYERLNARPPPVAMALPPQPPAAVERQESVVHAKSTANVGSPAATSSVMSHGTEGEGETPRVETPRTMDNLKDVALRLDEISASLQELKLSSSSRHEGELEEEKSVNSKLDVVSERVRNVEAKLTEVFDNVSALDEHAVATRANSRSSELAHNETKDRLAELVGLIGDMSRSVDELRNQNNGDGLSALSQKLDAIEGTQRSSAESVVNSVSEVHAKLSELGGQIANMRTVIEQREEVKSPGGASSSENNAADMLSSFEAQLGEFSTQMQDYFAPELQKINENNAEKITSECKKVLNHLEVMADALLRMKTFVESESQSLRETVTEYHELTGRRLMEEIAPKLTAIDARVGSLSHASAELLSSHKASVAENASLQEQVRRVITNISTNGNMTDDLLKDQDKKLDTMSERLAPLDSVPRLHGQLDRVLDKLDAVEQKQVSFAAESKAIEGQLQDLHAASASSPSPQVQDGATAPSHPPPAAPSAAFAQILSRLDDMNALMHEEREERRALSAQVREVSARLDRQATAAARRPARVLSTPPPAKSRAAADSDLLDEKELAEKVDRSSPHSNPEESSTVLHPVRSDGSDQELIQALDEKIESVHQLLEEVASRVQDDHDGGSAGGDLARGGTRPIMKLLRRVEGRQALLQQDVHNIPQDVNTYRKPWTVSSAAGSLVWNLFFGFLTLLVIRDLVLAPMDFHKHPPFREYLY